MSRPKRPYSPECVEGMFRELRAEGALRRVATPGAQAPIRSTHCARHSGASKGSA